MCPHRWIRDRIPFFKCMCWLSWVLWTECLCLPEFICWKPKLNSQGDGIRRWGLWEVIRSWGWSPCDGISALIRDLREMIFLFSTLWTWEECLLKSGSGLSLDTKSTGTLILDFPASRTVRNQCLLCKPHSLWYSWYSSLSWLRCWIIQDTNSFSFLQATQNVYKQCCY